MKKVLGIFLTAIFIFPFTVYATSSPDITSGAESAVMIDYMGGEILYDKNAHERRSVASLVKMMGLVLIMEKIDEGTLKTDEILTVSQNAKEMGGTQIWLEEGEKISVDDLLKGITMASANDAMVLMAERVSGTEEAFVKEMNDKASELGLKNTKFVNVTGFDEDGSYSSAYDMAIIAKELNVSLDKITMDKHLVDDLGADSLDAVELIMALEDEFNLEVDDEAAQNMKYVKDLVQYIENHQS